MSSLIVLAFSTRLRVARIRPLAELQFFPAHAHFAAEQYPDYCATHAYLHAAQAEFMFPAMPLGRYSHGEQVADIPVHAIRDAGAQLIIAGCRDQASWIMLSRTRVLTGYRHFHLPPHVQVEQIPAPWRQYRCRGNVRRD